MRRLSLLMSIFLAPAALGGAASIARGPGVLPDFRLESLNQDRTADLQRAHLSGAPAILQFWASWCTSCRGVRDDLKVAMQGFDVRLVAVSLDESRRAALDGLASWGDSLGGLRPTFYFDRGGQLAGKLGHVAVPTVIVVGANGLIRARINGHWNAASRGTFVASLRHLQQKS